MNNVLLVHVPSQRIKDDSPPFPLGLLYVGRILESLGKRVKVIDLYLYDFPADDKWGYLTLKNFIDDFRPDIIGYGGIATSYVWTKGLSVNVKKDYSDIIQIAGSALSSVYDLLLNKAKIDVVFHGEVENSLPAFIERLDNGKSWADVPGISYLSGNEIKKTPPAMQIMNLDDIPFPAYHLIDMKKYFRSMKYKLGIYKKDLVDQGLYESIAKRLENVEFILPMATSRGCTHRCLFCYRHVKGYRKYSVGYLIRHIKYVKERFGIDGFSFCDELFNGNTKWIYEFCDEIDKNKLKIFYGTSARADNVSEDMLRRMSETGCYHLLYGQESGSDTILKEYSKGITRKQNLDATLLTRKAGIYSTVQLVIGSPGETRQTIQETIDFLKEVGVQYYSLNYLIPFPETPIWQYVLENNLISDVEAYLEQVVVMPGSPVVNLTKVPDKEWKNWADLIKYKTSLHHLKSRGSYKGLLQAVAKYQLKRILPEKIKRFISRSIEGVRGKM